MTRSDRLLVAFGILAAAILLATPMILGALLPGYDALRQTISEIGERGSPFERMFATSQLAAAAAILIFAAGLARNSLRRSRSLAPATLLALYGLAVIGIAVFEAPHPLHNVFGISTMLGFLTPLAVAVVWRKDRNLRMFRRLSAGVGFILVIGMAFNLSPLFVQYDPSDFVRANYGFIQRAVLLPFYVWCGLFATALLKDRAPVASSDLDLEALLEQMSPETFPEKVDFGVPRGNETC